MLSIKIATYVSDNYKNTLFLQQNKEIKPTDQF